MAQPKSIGNRGGDHVAAEADMPGAMKAGTVVVFFVLVVDTAAGQVSRRAQIGICNDPGSTLLLPGMGLVGLRTLRNRWQ